MVDRKKPTTNYQLPTTAAKLLVIVGPTASGKSALALEVAKTLNGEIICADSRTVYRHLEIGTAKPTERDRKEVPHHVLDVVAPDENFTVANFKRLAEAAIQNIQQRGKLPILVGGSGLYIDSVLFDYKFAASDAPKDPVNPRHLHRDVARTFSELKEHTLVVGLDVPRDELLARIKSRAEDMLSHGFADEVRFLKERYPDSKALLAPGYKAFSEHLDGHLSLEDAKALFIKNDYRLAKRQMTWFKRNKNVHWLDSPSTYIDEVISLLNKLH